MKYTRADQLRPDPDKLRAGQLAELAGVSLPTIKHYVNEGLIPKPLKTGKTMAYYDRACVDRIKLIKKLQKEQFLPLDVIKRVLDSGSAYEEELQMGQALIKSHKLAHREKAVAEHTIERRTGYPMQKIRLLEQEGLLIPAKSDGARMYDAIDCKVIEIMKRREELGVPFDHSVETLRLYRDAIEQAVGRDIRLFARNLLGEFSHTDTLRFLTEVDDSLDTFVVLIRQKMLRVLSSEAIKQMNEIPKRLAMLSIFPLKGKYLPEEPPRQSWLRIFYHFYLGAYDSVIEKLRDDEMPTYGAATVLAQVLRGNMQEALHLLDLHAPRPTGRVLDDAAAALAYMVSVGETSGFSGPTHLVRRALYHLKEVERAGSKKDPGALLGRYICGAIYVMLPDIFETLTSGIRLLADLEQTLRNRDMKLGPLPPWADRTIRFEVVPAIEVRVNRFLAEGYLRQGDREETAKCLARIIELTEPGSEHSRWARLKKLEVKKVSDARA